MVRLAGIRLGNGHGHAGHRGEAGEGRGDGTAGGYAAGVGRGRGDGTGGEAADDRTGWPGPAGHGHGETDYRPQRDFGP
jgi:hypothetical protein